MTYSGAGIHQNHNSPFFFKASATPSLSHSNLLSFLHSSLPPSAHANKTLKR